MHYHLKCVRVTPMCYFGEKTGTTNIRMYVSMLARQMETSATDLRFHHKLIHVASHCKVTAT